MALVFTRRQLAHVLASLRFCQRVDISHMPHFEDESFMPLSAEEVDVLCETLNSNRLAIGGSIRETKRKRRSP